MREIEFRAKNFVNDEWQWVYGYYAPVYLFEKDGEENHTYCIVSDKCIGRTEMLGCGVQSGLPAHYLIKQETLGQYSEIKDRKGSKIFEGDIVKYCIHTQGCEDLDKNYVVEYSFGGFRLREDLYDECSDYIDNDSVDWDRCEIIGNIYDNPELIKESE